MCLGMGQNLLGKKYDQNIKLHNINASTVHSGFFFSLSTKLGQFDLKIIKKV